MPSTSKKELTYMNNAINMVSDADPYKEKMCYAFYVLLEEKNKANSLLQLDFRRIRLLYMHVKR